MTTANTSEGFREAIGELPPRQARALARRRAILRPLPLRLERELAREYRRRVEAIDFIVRRSVLPQIRAVLREVPDDVRADALSDVVGSIVERVRAEFGSILRASGAASAVARRASRWGRDRFRDAIETATGVRPDLTEPWLPPLIAEFGQRNAQLLSDVGEQFATRLGLRITAGALEGMRAEELSEEIQREFMGRGLAVMQAKRRADLIARDQLASLFGDLDRARQRNIGIQRYRWRTARDSKVRKSHRAREGEIFEWAPIRPQLRRKGLPADQIDGHPGRPINCRCIAEPVLEDLVPA